MCVKSPSIQEKLKNPLRAQKFPETLIYIRVHPAEKAGLAEKTPTLHWILGQRFLLTRLYLSQRTLYSAPATPVAKAGIHSPIKPATLYRSV